MPPTLTVVVTNPNTRKNRQLRVLRIKQERLGEEKRLRIQVSSGDVFYGPWIAATKNMRQNMVFTATTEVIEFAQQASEELKMALAKEFERPIRRKRKSTSDAVALYSHEPTPKRRRVGRMNPSPVLNANVHFQDGKVVAEVRFEGMFTAVKKWLQGFLRPE